MAKSVFTFERSMVSLQRETFYLIDRASRKVTMTIQGKSDTVEIPARELHRLKNNIICHNHPRWEDDFDYFQGGWGFSAGDVGVAIDNDVFQSRVVGWDYFKDVPCVYVMTRKGDKWSVNYEEADAMFDKLKDHLAKKVGRDMDAVEATFRCYHEWVNQLSVRFGFYYDLLYF